MKLSVQLTLVDLPSIDLIGEGDVIRIGRDPGLECVIPESHARGVSWLHAKLESTDQGFIYTDVGSSYGSYFNSEQERLSRPRAVKVGDRIQLGLGESGLAGPCLKFTTLEANSDEKLSPSSRLFNSKPSLTSILALACCLLITLGVTFIFQMNGRELEPEAALQTSIDTRTEPISSKHKTEPIKVASSDLKEEHIRVDDPQVSSSEGRDKKWNEAELELISQVAIGKYQSIPNTLPSILLQRKGEGFPWIPLQVDRDQVLTNTTLMSLPGSHSAIMLNSGLEFYMWGNLPEFSTNPLPLRESVVQLQSTKKEPLTITLARGRILLCNPKSSMKSAQVRLRFQDQLWVLELSPAAETVAELWWLKDDSKSATLRFIPVMGMFTRGSVRVAAQSSDLQLREITQVVWTKNLAKPTVKQLHELPSWWNSKPEKSESMMPALLALREWTTILNRYDREIIDAVTTFTNERKEPHFQEVGMHFQAALDLPSPLLERLRAQNPVERSLAADCLRPWLQRNALHVRMLEQCMTGYSTEKQATLVKLLLGYCADELVNPSTAQHLVELLNHDNVEIRHLALMHLTKQFPEATGIEYNPNFDERERIKPITAWKQLVAQRSSSINRN